MSSVLTEMDLLWLCEVVGSCGVDVDEDSGNVLVSVCSLKAMRLSRPGSRIDRGASYKRT